MESFGDLGLSSTCLTCEGGEFVSHSVAPEVPAVVVVVVVVVVIEESLSS